MNQNPPYQNRWTGQGKVVTQPKVTSLNKNLRMTSFDMLVLETWTNGSTGHQASHRNVVPIEALGVHSDKASSLVKGQWLTVVGYIRTDEIKGVHTTRIRTLEIHDWKRSNGEASKESLPFPREPFARGDDSPKY